MTYEEYRQHMRKYSRDTMVMSFVVTKHPDYEAIQAAGDEVIPWLLNDLLDPDWHCGHCYGEGFEFPPDWEWDAVKRNWPTDTGIPCTECNGKGHINSWACMTLLWEHVGRDKGPKVEERMRGRHGALTKLWRDWGVEHGYLKAPQPLPEEESFLTTILRALGWKK